MLTPRVFFFSLHGPGDISFHWIPSEKHKCITEIIIVRQQRYTLLLLAALRTENKCLSSHWDLSLLTADFVIMANQSTEILLKSVKLRRHLFLWRIIQRNFTECLHLLLLLSERNRDSTIQNNKLLFPYFSVKIDLLEKKCKSAYIFLGNMSWIKVSFCTPSTNLLHIAFRVRKINLYLVSCCWEIITKTFSVHLCSCCNVWVSSISRKKTVRALCDCWLSG